jgi:hypothetical protein
VADDSLVIQQTKEQFLVINKLPINILNIHNPTIPFFVAVMMGPNGCVVVEKDHPNLIGELDAYAK